MIFHRRTIMNLLNVDMISLRYIRRRGVGFLCKTVLVFVAVVALVQITTSAPQRDRAAREALEQSQKDVENQNADVVRLPEEHRKTPEEEAVDRPVEQNLLEHPVLAAMKTTKMQTPIVQKKSRKGAFYENIMVHFDLKGAPPKIPYFLDMLKLVAKSGATGILLEWEEMFPWTGKLEMVRGTDAYNLEEIKTILREATSLGLEIVPLVQTFGHLEWFLKFEEFRKYRENDAFPQVLCLGDADGVEIVKDALKQVINVHKEFGINYFHIGADEAFEFGVCEKSRTWINEHAKDGGKQVLALTHLKNMALYVKELVGQQTTVLAWHDMLKDFDGRHIKALDLGSIVQPVIWDYSEQIVTMPDQSFSILADNFPIVWASSAYKGANFPSAKFIDVRHYETNNRAWISTKSTQERKFKKFEGIIITGWQRYDHMAGLCEILPMGTVSMVLQVQIALAGLTQDQQAIRDKAAKILGCSGYNVAGLNLISNQCTFPGFSVYSMFQGTAKQQMEYIEAELDKSHHLMGWLREYNIVHNISQTWYLGQINSFVTSLHSQISGIENQLRTEMSKLFFSNTVDEFLYESIGPVTDKLVRYIKQAKRLSELRTFPKRHFKIIREEL